MQTSNFSLNPKYEYIRSTGKQVLKGYQASNQLSVRVRDLDTLGETLDALVGAGGNTFSGLQFGLDDDSAVRDEARTKAMKNARAKAKLYADAAGMEVARIVSISESGNYNRPQPMMQARMQAVESSGAPTPIAGGEVGYTANVNVRFELR